MGGQIDRKRQMEIMRELFEECLATAAAKGRDYSGDEDALASFKEDAATVGITKYQNWYTMFNKHCRAITNGIKANPSAPEVASEPLRGRVVDAIVYLTIFMGLLEEDATGSQSDPGLGTSGLVPVSLDSKSIQLQRDVHGEWTHLVYGMHRLCSLSRDEARALRLPRGSDEVMKSFGVNDCGGCWVRLQEAMDGVAV